jgi:hypothetical protein
VPLGAGGLRLGGRFGYPGLLLGAFEEQTELSYWDYQARYDARIARNTYVQLVTFGSLDFLQNPPWAEPDDQFSDIDIEFHRLEGRLVYRRKGSEIGSALRLGYDDSAIDNELAVQAFSIGPRLWARFRLAPEATLRMGADMLGSVGSIDSVSGRAPTVFAGRRQIRVDLPQYADVPARNAGGAFAELALQPAAWTRVNLGARSDVWVVQGETSVAADPRVRWTVLPVEDVELYVAGGIAHQPAVYLVPVPGLTEVALDRGLQQSLQSELGVGFELPFDIRLDVQGYLHSYDDLLLPELYAPDDGATVPTVEALSYGIELFARRRVGAISGSLSYTLGWASAEGPGGEKFAPEFDVRHVLNLVLQYSRDLGWQAGTRLHFRSGRPFNQFPPAETSPTYRVRLPPFARADARVGYAWRTDWGVLTAYGEWLNLTLAEEYLGAECLYGSCEAQSARPLPVLNFGPNVGVRAAW